MQMFSTGEREWEEHASDSVKEYEKFEMQMFFAESECWVQVE